MEADVWRCTIVRSPCDMTTFTVASLRIGTSLGKSSGRAALLPAASVAMARSPAFEIFSLLPQPNENAASTIISATTACAFTVDRWPCLFPDAELTPPTRTTVDLPLSVRILLEARNEPLREQP